MLVTTLACSLIVYKNKISSHHTLKLVVASLLVPSKVRELTVSKATASSLAYSLTWEPPASPNGIIRFYKVCVHVGGRRWVKVMGRTGSVSVEGALGVQ